MKGFRSLQARSPRIGEVRGLGMLQAVELVLDRERKTSAAAEAAEVVAAALRRGLLINNRGGRLGNVLKFSPPLVITDEQLQAGLEILDQALQEVEERVLGLRPRTAGRDVTR